MLWKLPAIRLAPDVIIPLPFLSNGNGITNTLLCTWLSAIALILIFYFAIRNAKMVPGRYQAIVEMLVEFLLGLLNSVVGDDKEKGKKFFPLVATFFLFILMCNLLDVIPGVDTIGAIDGEAIAKLHTHTQPVLGFLMFGDISNQIIPWIRPATSDLNLTLAMAIISVVTTQVFGFIALGPREHLTKYFNFPALFRGGVGGVIEFITGLIEVISEIARIISFSFRLFGNIFAGSALLAVFAFLLPFVADIIFIPFELFVAGVQALVFSLLTLVFLQIATTSHAEHANPQSEHGAHVDAEQARGQEQIAREAVHS